MHVVRHARWHVVHSLQQVIAQLHHARQTKPEDGAKLPLPPKGAKVRAYVSAHHHGPHLHRDCAHAAEPYARGAARRMLMRWAVRAVPRRLRCSVCPQHHHCALRVGLS